MKMRKVPLNKKEQLFEAALDFADRAGLVQPHISQTQPWTFYGSNPAGTHPELLKNTKPIFADGLLLFFAEWAGFEPAVPFPVRQFSKLFLSATQAPLRYWQCKHNAKISFCKAIFHLQMQWFDSQKVFLIFRWFLLQQIVINTHMMNTF